MGRELGRPPVVALVNSINRKPMFGYHFADSEPVVSRAKQPMKNNNGATCAYLTKKKLHCYLRKRVCWFYKDSKATFYPKCCEDLISIEKLIFEVQDSFYFIIIFPIDIAQTCPRGWRNDHSAILFIRKKIAHIHGFRERDKS